MRQTIIIIFTATILSSFSIEKTRANDNGFNKIDSLKQIFSPILNGVWVINDYIKEIEKTKSPLKSKDKLNGIVTMVIRSNIPKDSLDVLVSWNNHEVSNFTLYFVAGQNANNIKTDLSDFNERTNYYEIGYKINKRDTVIFLYHYNKNNKLLDKKQFNKILNDQLSNDETWGIRIIVNEKLISGNYNYIDIHNSQAEIHFHNDGLLTGFYDFSTYEISTDFNGWSPWEYVDRICFDLLTDHSKCFAFKITGKSLNLYELTFDDENGIMRIGKLKYSLIRL